LKVTASAAVPPLALAACPWLLAWLTAGGLRRPLRRCGRDDRPGLLRRCRVPVEVSRLGMPWQGVLPPLPWLLGLPPVRLG
jgi:hypothetical protein